jgi:hypothetical protein
VVPKRLRSPSASIIIAVMHRSLPIVK